MDGKEPVAQTKKVAIIGAGVAGLQLAERLLSCGITQLTIFEKASTVGGVWRENYADFSLQVPKELCAFTSTRTNTPIERVILMLHISPSL